MSGCGPVQWHRTSKTSNVSRRGTGNTEYRAAGRAAGVRQYQQGARQTARACVVRACVRACVTTSQLKFLGGHIRGPGRPISHTKPPGITHQTPKRKEEVENKTKALFDLFELTSPPPSTCPMPHHRLDRPNPPPPSRTLHPPAASGCVKGERSALPLHALDICLEPHIPPPYPISGHLTPVFEPPPFCTTRQRETGRHNAKDGHAYRHAHHTRVTHEYRAAIRG
jgi:hypothetical protein